MYWLIFITIDSPVCVTVQQKSYLLLLISYPLPYWSVAYLSFTDNSLPVCLRSLLLVRMGPLTLCSLSSQLSVHTAVTLDIFLVPMSEHSNQDIFLVPSCRINSQTTKLKLPRGTLSKSSNKTLANLAMTQKSWTKMFCKQYLQQEFLSEHLNTLFSAWPSSIFWKQ